ASASFPAESRGGALEAADPGPRLAVRLQRRGECRRDVHQLPPTQGRQGRAAAHPDRARLRLRAPRRQLKRSLSVALTLRTRLVLSLGVVLVLALGVMAGSL